MATRPKAVIESRNGEKLSPITIAKNVLTDDGKNLHDILSDRKEDMMTPTIENSSSIFKVGQGDNVDYSANVVNGAYESMVLKGKTMVNCIQEPSSQDVILPYAFTDGQYVTINDTKESGTLGVELKGQTLVNIHKSATYTLSRQNSGWYDNYVTKVNEVSFTITDTSETGWKYLKLGNLNLNFLKPNTKYLVVFSETKNLSTVQFMNGDGTKKISNTATVTNNRAILTTNSTLDLSNQVLYTLFHMKLGEVVAKNAMIIEYQEGMENWDISYFEGMTSCKMPILITCGKNLLPLGNGQDMSSTRGVTFTQKDGKLLINGTATDTADYRVFNHNNNVEQMKKFNSFPVGTTLTMSNNLGKDCYFNVIRNGSSIYLNKTITIQDGDKDINAFVRINRGETYNNTELNIQIEEGASATAYEPYKSSILSLPEEIVLRKLPNGVCDTFNTRTGVYTQRIGEAVVNGSENWQLNNTEGTTTQRFFCNNMLANSAVDNNTKGTQQYLCDRLRTIAWNQTCELGVTINGSGVFVYNNSIEYTVNSVKQWLSQNPVKLQYELATPVVTKINLSSALKSWNTTTHIYSEIPENTLYPTLSHSNPTYPVILKPSTKYSIVANSYSNGHTNSTINFNLGGATASTTVGNRVTTITTPSTLSNELLTMSGRGNKLNNVMVIEGDVVGDESYFEGMCDCKSPIVSNVGKNLFTTRDSNIETNPNHKLDVLGENHIEITATTNDTGWLYTTYKVKGLVPNTTYILSGDVLEGTNNSSGSKGVMLIHDFNTSTSSESVDSSNRAIRYTTPKDVTKVRVLFYSSLKQTPNKIGDTYSFKNIQLEKATSPTAYEPYKSNILSCNGDKIELTKDMFEQGSIYFSANSTFTSMTSNTDGARVRTKQLLNLEIGKTYTLTTAGSMYFTLSRFNSDDKGVDETGWIQSTVITSTSEINKFGIAIKIEPGGAKIDNFNSDEIALREVDKTIVLRSLPNGVCDTLNVETGEYVQNVVDIVLDGTENWILNNWGTNDNFCSFEISSLNNAKIQNIYKQNSYIDFYCDTFKVLTNCKWNYMGEKHIRQWSDGNRATISVIIPKSELKTYDVTGFIEYLTKNNIRINIRANNPIVSTVDIQGFPYAYTNGHVQLSSGSIEQSLTPKVEYSVVTNRNGQIRSNQKMVERHQKQLDRLQSMILTNLVNTQYEQTLTNLKYDLKNVREEVK